MNVIGLISEVLVIALCLAAVTMNVLLVTSCELLDVSLTSSSPSNNNNNNNTISRDGTVGLFQWKLPGQHTDCIDISSSSEEIDQSFLCARWAAIVACCFGIVLLVSVTFEQCVVQLPYHQSQLWMDVSAVCIQICLGLVYVLWYSKVCTDYYNCTLGPTFIYLFITHGLWLFAWVFTRCMRPGRWNRKDEIAMARQRRAERKAEAKERRAEQKAAAKEEKQRKREEMEAQKQERQRQKEEEAAAAKNAAAATGAGNAGDGSSMAPSETSSMQVGVSVANNDEEEGVLSTNNDNDDEEEVSVADTEEGGTSEAKNNEEEGASEAKNNEEGEEQDKYEV